MIKWNLIDEGDTIYIETPAGEIIFPLDGNKEEDDLWRKIAHQIVSVPDLLAACLKFLYAERLADEFGIDDDETIDALIEVTELVSVAVAKARGE